MASWDFPPARMVGTECVSKRWVLGPISRHPAPRNARPQMLALAALAAMALAVDAAEPAPQPTPPNNAPAPKYGVGRFRLLPPWEDPTLVKGPVPPPADKNYGVALAEVVLIDTSIWAFNYL